MVKRCLLVFGGEIKDKADFSLSVQAADYIIAADGGVRHLLGIDVVPNRIMGDMDSIDIEHRRILEKQHCPMATFPQEKDFTDGYLVLQEAVTAGYEEIEIWGALGGRADHSFANIMLLLAVEAMAKEGQAACKTKAASIESSVEPSAKAPYVCLRDGGVWIFLARSGQIIKGQPGDRISLFALGEAVTGFHNQGLKYQPPQDRYDMAVPLGISNEMTQEQACISWEKGRLLCMHISKNQDIEDNS
jgi:thiamine pyrophosphokinase